MESEHNASYNGTITDRNGARTARPRLADLLESVKIPDETLGNGTNGAHSTQESTHYASTAVVDEATVSEPVDFDASSRLTSSEPLIRGEHADESNTNGLSSASIAAQKRRQALYARRNNESAVDTTPSELSPQVSDNNASGMGRGTENSGSEFDSLASRLFGDRASSSFDSPSSDLTEPNTFAPVLRESDSAPSSSTETKSLPPIDSLLNGSSSASSTQENPTLDWTAKYAADAPLSPMTDRLAPDLSVPDLSAGIQSKGGSMENGNPLDAPQSVEYEQPVTRRFSTTSPSANESLNAVNIKGRSDGVSIELGQGQWPAIMDALSQRLIQSTGFFRGGKVTLDVGVRPLQENELQEICDLTEKHGLTVTSVRSRSEQSCQLALATGLAASLDAPDGLLAQPALSNYEKLEHFVYRGNLRSGQILRRAETILVMGDVNPGSQIISDSDILIWGRLRGIAHAGASGDTSSVIAALLMEPTQIRIADAIAILPEQEAKTSIAERFAGNTAPSGVKRPEIAHSMGEDIIVDVWDDSKPGGIMAFRRSII